MSEEEPKIVQDLHEIIDMDSYAWMPVWGPGRSGKTTVAMLLMYKIYKDWDDVLGAIVFNLNQLIYNMKKGIPQLFPTRTKPCHMRVPVLTIDDFASQCGKAKTQHEKVWDLFKGHFDTLGTRVGVIFATMIEPTSPTEQLLLKYTHEVMVERITDTERYYKYDKCRRQQDYKGWKNRQKKDWMEKQTFGRVPSGVYKQYDEMRMSLVDEAFVSMSDQMVDDNLAHVLKRITTVDITLLKLITAEGPMEHKKLGRRLGDASRQALTRCKSRGLVVSIHKGNRYYVNEITDLGLEVLKAVENEGRTPELTIHNLT